MKDETKMNIAFIVPVALIILMFIGAMVYKNARPVDSKTNDALQGINLPLR